MPPNRKEEEHSEFRVLLRISTEVIEASTTLAKTHREAFLAPCWRTSISTMCSTCGPISGGNVTERAR